VEILPSIKSYVSYLTFTEIFL